jgi:hypothetical protein
MVAPGLNVLLLRATLVAGSLALVFSAFTLTGAAPAIWRATVVCTAVFYALAHAIPDVIFRVQSMPYTYQLHNNFGARGFELQNVTYAAYHTHWYNHATHAAFPLEAWLWFVVAAHWGGALGLAALCSVLCAQAFSFGERRFALGVSTLWIGFAVSAGVALAMLGQGVLEIAQLGLVSFGFWRFTGHWVEPLPPGVVGNRGFVRRADANAGWRLCLPLALGYLSEFAAGLPFRLVNSWLFRAAERLGYRPLRALGLNRTHEFAIRIHEQGWSAQATTAALVSAARELGVDRLSARGVSPREASAR